MKNIEQVLEQISKLKPTKEEIEKHKQNYEKKKEELLSYVDPKNIKKVLRLLESMRIEDQYNNSNEVNLLIDKLMHQLAVVRNKMFGKTSEKSKNFIVNEVEENSTISLQEVEKEYKKVGRKPNEKMTSKVIAEDKIQETFGMQKVGDFYTCPICNHSYEIDSTYESVKLELYNAIIKASKITIPTTECPNCGAKPFDLIAPDLLGTFGKSFCTPSLAAYIATLKYEFCLPLYSQEEYFSSLGVNLSRKTLSNYVICTAAKLKPVYELLKTKLLENPLKVIHADETPIKVLQVSKEQNRQTCYEWIYATAKYEEHPIYLYKFEENRKAENPLKFLQDFKGTVVCDDYSAYNNIPNITLARCWAHARRKFTDLLLPIKNNVPKDSISKKAIDIIDEMFELDRTLQTDANTSEEFLELRNQKIKPLVDQYFELLKSVETVSDLKLSQAIKYSLKIETDLRVFLSNPNIPLSNNMAERIVKRFVMARKNFLFSNTSKGAEASSILITLIMTAKANGLVAYDYLCKVLERIDDIKISELESLLPWNYKR